jgi:Domain of unknown function (DUF1707)
MRAPKLDDEHRPLATGQYAIYRVGSSSRDVLGADEELLVARYGGTAVTEARRDVATAQLREHYAAGRLSLDQFQDRLDGAYRAQTDRELNAVTDGLPHVGKVIPAEAPWGGYPGGSAFNVTDMRAALARTGRRIMLVLGVLTAGSLVVLALVITAFLVHGGLFAIVVAALLAILAVAVVATGALMWLARRLWRRHAWIEAVPSVAGQPWLSLVARIARLLFTGHALWRLRNRLVSRA